MQIRYPIQKFFMTNGVVCKITQLFGENKNKQHKETAIANLEEAVLYWDQYRAISEKNYKPQRLARTRVLDWTELMEFVKADIQLAKNFKGS